MSSKNEKQVGSGLRLLARSGLVVFVGLFLSKVLSYAYRIIIARSFGAEAYGLFSLALMVVGWFIAFSALGLSEGLIRYIPFYRGKKALGKVRYLLRWTSGIFLGSGVVAGALLYFLAEPISVGIFHNPGLILYLQWFSILIPVSLFVQVILGTLRAYEKIGWYTFLFNVLQNAVKVAALGIFAWLGWQAEGVVFSYLLGIMSMLLIGYFVCKTQLSEVFVRPDISEKERGKVRKEVFSYSWPLLLYGIVFNIFFWIDSFAIGFFQDATAVGWYNAAVPIAVLLGLAPELFMQLFFPLITKEYARKRVDVIEQLSKQVAKWIFVLNVPALILIFLFPGAFINILFGAEYLVAETALQILAVGMFFFSLMTVSQQLVSMAGKSKTILMNFAGASVVNLGLNIWLVPLYGITGAALATSSVYVLLYVTFFVQTKRYLGVMPLRRRLVGVVAASIIPLLVILWLRSMIVVRTFWVLLGLLALFGILYLGCLWLFRSFDRNDMMIVRAVLKRAKASVRR